MSFRSDWSGYAKPFHRVAGDLVFALVVSSREPGLDHSGRDGLEERACGASKSTSSSEPCTRSMPVLLTSKSGLPECLDRALDHVVLVHGVVVAPLPSTR